MIKIGSLFTGYGGLDLAAEDVFDGRTVWVSDVDQGACKIIAERFGDVQNLGDIRGIAWADVEPVEVMIGGFPCQDVSSAGRRAGLKQGTRTGLWSEMLYAITELRPKLIIVENVMGLLNAEATSNVEPCPVCVGSRSREPLRALGAVLGDLAYCGYDAEWRCLRASEVGAPHQRSRVFVVATADTGFFRSQAGPQHEITWPDTGTDVDRSREHDRVALLPTPTTTQRGTDANTDTRPGARANLHNEVIKLLPTPSTDEFDRGKTIKQRIESQKQIGLHHALDQLQATSRQDRFKQYAPAIERWETILGREAPDPLVKGRMSTEFVEWMMGLDHGWVTGVPKLSRSAQLKALGNGVVPLQAATAMYGMINIDRLREAA